MDEALGNLIELSDLSLGLIDLADLTLLSVSPSALQRLGLAEADVVGRSVLDLLGTRDREAAVIALGALRDGVIDFYQAHRSLGAPGRRRGLDRQWVRAIRMPDARWAIVEASGDDDPVESPLASYLGSAPAVMAVGSMDDDWIVRLVSCEIHSLIGVAPDDFLGTRLVPPATARRVDSMLASSTIRGAVSLPITVPDRAGTPTRLGCVVLSMVGASARCFMLVPHRAAGVGTIDRSLILESHLRNIAAELEASGVLRRVGSVQDPAFDQVPRLTSRQWDVLRRLLRGQRVATIARAMYISDSTVRNHLSAIFERFGVHSQSELLALFDGTDMTSSETDGVSV